MASGKTHAKVAGLVFVGTAAASPWIYSQYGADAAIGAIIGAGCGYIVTPDIDLATLTREENRMRRRFGFLGRLWVAYWAAYGSLMTHRGISHAPVIGTATRAIYGLWWLALVTYGTWPVVAPLATSAFVAWCIQDIGHLAFDRFGFRWVL